MSPSGRVRVLVLVEGARAESDLFRSLADAYGLPLEIVPYETNIYKLYRRVVEDANEPNEATSYLNLKDILREWAEDEVRGYREKINSLGGGNHSPDAERVRLNWQSQLGRYERDLVTLNQDFAYTYLVFDCDIHHREKDDPDGLTEGVMNRNLSVLEKMLQHFTDETDETIGKLYVNYPMLESWRDANEFFDSDYRNAKVVLADLESYKSSVSQKRLSGKCQGLLQVNLTQFSQTDVRDKFDQIMRMMVYKLNWLVNEKWGGLDYDQYRTSSEGTTILEVEKAKMRDECSISVLNTSFFAVLDYKGNRAGEFDRIVGGM